jgi:hypothetical protein
MLKLWDWCVCVGNKHIGVYLAVALLGIYASALCTMSGDCIQQWIEEVTSAHPQWHT